MKKAHYRLIYMNSRIDKEKDIISLMIRMYCTRKHNVKDRICDECKSLLDYAIVRLSNCKYGNSKSSCGRCKTPCYKPEMKIKIKEVMRYSGPRIIIYKPMEFVRHLAK